MIRICTDSCCDLNQKLLEDNDIKFISLGVILGDKEFLDGVNIKPSDIFEYVKNTGILPKTAARSVEDYIEFFKSQLEGDNEVIHISLSSELSSSYNNACSAKDEIGSDKLHVIDSKSLSTGIGLLVLYAVKLAREGKSAQEIVDIINKQTEKNQASFVVDKLEYLYKGGRCSAMARFGANLLKIKPRLELINGKIENTGKYMGQFKNVLFRYVDDMLKIHSNAKTDICFVTHTCLNRDVVESVIEYVKRKNIFDNVVETVAGSTISSHCGENTLGILYLLN